MALTPADLIFDLTTALREALAAVEADRGIRTNARLCDTLEVLNPETDERVRFDAEAAYAALAAADAWPDGKPRGSLRSLRLPMTVAFAEQCSEGLADLLCWARGFMAGCPDRPDDHPMGVEQAREMRIALRSAIAKARGDKPEEMPF